MGQDGFDPEARSSGYGFRSESGEELDSEPCDCCAGRHAEALSIQDRGQTGDELPWTNAARNVRAYIPDVTPTI